MAEKQIRLPRWNGEEYYPATTTDAVADKERRKALSDIISDIEQDIQIQSATSDSQYNALKEDVDKNTSDIAILMGNDEGSVSKKVSDEIAKVVAGAPADLNTLKEIADYIASDKTQAAEIVSAIDNLNNLRIIDLGTKAANVAVNEMTNYIKETDIRTPQVFKWVATDGSSTLAVSIARLRGYGWMQYLFSRGGIERRAISQTGEVEKWESYGGVLSNTTGDDDTKVMSQKAITDELNKKQDQLKHYYEGDDYARMYYKKDTDTGGNISIAHMLDDTKAGMYYAERDAGGRVTHEDNIYLTETYGNDEGHIGISSTDNENGITVRSSRITVKPTRIAITNNSGSLTFADNAVEMRSNNDADGLNSFMRLTSEQAWLMHHRPNKVDYVNPTTGETEQRQSGIGIVATDNSIAFYSEVGNYNAPLAINADGTIRVAGIQEDLATHLKALGGTDKVLSEELAKKASSESVSELQEEIDEKAPKVGYAPDLKVNFAKELVGRGDATPEVIGGIRPTGEISIGDGNATIERIKGESVVWNQLVNHSHWKSTTNNGVTFTVEDDGPVVVNGTATGLARIMVNRYFGLKANHKYALTGTPNNANGATLRYFGTALRDEGNGSIVNITTDNYNALAIEVTEGLTIDNAIFCPQLHDLTLMFGAGNEPTTIEEFEARKPLGVSNDYNEGTIVSYDGDALKSVGFNAWDEEWENGGISGDGNNWNDDRTTTAIRTTELVPVAPNQTYEISYPSRVTTLQGVMYDKDGKAITGSVFYTKEITTLPECRYIRVSWFDYLTSTIKGYQHDICIHLKHTYTPEKYPNGYAPYEADTHLLPDVKSILDAEGNQLFPYGLLSAGSVHDEITATKAIKRVGVVDMGTLSWILSGGLFQSRISSFSYKTTGNILCNKYPYVSRGTVESTDKSMSQNSGDSLVVIKDSSYTDATTFKQAMSGVLLYYELVTPVEIDLPEPLNMTYEAWDFGTEELVYDTPTTPLNADIVYQFNAVDRIRENSSAIKDKADKTYVNEAIATAITTTLNTEV